MINKEEMMVILSESKSMREVLDKCGLTTNGSGNYTNIKRKIKNLGLEVPVYNYYGNGFSKLRLSDDEVFCVNSSYTRQKLKKRIIDGNLIDYRCNDCGNIGEHNDKKLVLQLDHINGINDDNRLCNLQFLCPNCHSQTTTFAGKNNKKTFLCECGNEKYKYSISCNECSSKNKRKVSERPDLETLLSDVNNLGYRQTGVKYGVSDNSIRKWIKKYEKHLDL